MRGNALKMASVLLTVTFLSGCNLLNSFKTSDDKAIVSDIQAKLYQDPVLKTRNIQVVSQKGVVVLTGDVNTDLEKGAAERLAGQVSGVKQVINQLNTSPAPAATSTPPEPAMTAANNPPPAQAEPRREAREPKKKPVKISHTAAKEPTQTANSNQSDASAAAPASTAQPAAAPAPPEPAAPPPPQQVEIPAGSVIDVRMIDGIDSERNRPGDEFAASLSSPVVVGDRVVIPAGSDARVRLIQSATAGRMKGQSQLQIELIEVSLNGTPYTVQSGAYQAIGASRGKRTAETVGAGAVIGGLIGAIAGKGKGAAIGAGIGAAGGAGVQAATKGEQVKIPAETKIEFTLKSPFTVTLPN
ncbi:MAG TPA: BON domain-containing protein [Terriglobia bacterium]|nr:BON domain-containing protein [Terriglobia bacterium]